MTVKASNPSDIRLKSEGGGELLEPRWPTCHAPSLPFFNKGFSLHPPSLLLLACGAARGPPDAYRQMSLVEQNTLCLTSHEATGLLRKLKGCLPSTDHSLKRTLAFLVS